MKFLKNRRAWRIWAKREFHATPPVQAPKEFPCYGIPTTMGAYYIYRGEIGEMQMKLALNAMASPM